MGKLSSFFSKIPFLSGLGGKKKSAKSNVELQYDKALNLMENGNAEDAVEILRRSLTSQSWIRIIRIFERMR